VFMWVMRQLNSDNGGKINKHMEKILPAALILISFYSLFQERLYATDANENQPVPRLEAEEKEKDNRANLPIEDERKRLSELRACSIHREHKPIRSRGISPPPYMVYEPWRKSYFLARPGEQNCVAIVEVTNEAQTSSEEKFALNPTRYDYGPIPDLERMTRMDADALWAQSPTITSSRLSSTADVCYRLVSISRSSIGKEFNFHCSFKNGYLVHVDIELPILSIMVHRLFARPKMVAGQ
jgi:hypothetical protein